MMTLKQARDEAHLGKFIAEKDANSGVLGDERAFGRILASMAGKAPKSPEASRPVRSED